MRESLHGSATSQEDTCTNMKMIFTTLGYDIHDHHKHIPKYNKIHALVGTNKCLP